MQSFVRRTGATAGLIIALTLSGSRATAADPLITPNLRDTLVVEVVKKTHLAVVNISATKLVQGRRGGGSGTVTGQSLGSGFIIHPDGYVATNNHVIAGARTITVQLDDGRNFPAEVVSADPDADLAILKIDDIRPFVYVALGDSQDLMVGEPAIAIGNPLGFGHSVSTGVVSGLNRDLNENTAQNGPTDTSVQNLIQTDAGITRGNSGGPLLNAYGQVIGINTAVLEQQASRFNDAAQVPNLGFAIPVNRLRDLIPKLMNPATVQKLEYPVKFAERRIVAGPDKIDAVVYPIDQQDSVLVDIDGKPVRNIVDAYDLILAAKTAHTLKLTFADGQTRSIIGKEMPAEPGVVLAREKLGLVVEQMTPRLANESSTTQEEGLYVDSALPNSPAAIGGIKPGDVIVGFAGQKFATLNDFVKAFEKLPPTTEKIRIQVSRRDSPKFYDVYLLRNVEASVTTVPATMP